MKPLKLHFLDAINPVINALIPTDPKKHTATELVSVEDFVKNKAAINVNIKTVAKPIPLDIKTPTIFFVDTGTSFFLLEIFLRIEKSLTFNKEYEGL